MIFVGAQSREGFIDIDSGILDSIKDIREEFSKSSLFTVVTKPDEAKIVLLIAGRRLAGLVGTAYPTGVIAAPIYGHAIDTVMHVGTYEKATTSEETSYGTWKRAAVVVVRDVTAWITANRDRLRHEANQPSPVGAALAACVTPM